MVLLKHPFKILILLTAMLVMCKLVSLKGDDSITRNQIEFQKLVETKRSNQAQEAQTAARDAATAEYQKSTVSNDMAKLRETERSNRERERQSQISLDETARSNRAREDLTRVQNVEQSRHNLAVEQLQNLTFLENQRANLAREAETTRSAKERERLQGEQNAETRRSNLAREGLSLDQLSEQIRSNLAQEAIRERANELSELNLSESMRSHKVQEALKSRELSDKYMWTDYANRLIDALIPSTDKESNGGKLDEKEPEELQAGSSSLWQQEQAKARDKKERGHSGRGGPF